MANECTRRGRSAPQHNAPGRAGLQLQPGIDENVRASRLTCGRARRWARSTCRSGDRMIRRSKTPLAGLLGIAVAASIVAACGTSTATAGPTTEIAGSPSPVSAVASASADASYVAAASAYASASASAAADSCSSPDIGLPHASAALEDLLPSTIGGVELCKFSLTVSAYVASTTGADNALYLPWLVKFGKTPADVNMAVATDLTQTENFSHPCDRGSRRDRREPGVRVRRRRSQGGLAGHRPSGSDAPERRCSRSSTPHRPRPAGWPATSTARATCCTDHHRQRQPPDRSPDQASLT